MDSGNDPPDPPDPPGPRGERGPDRHGPRRARGHRASHHGRPTRAHQRRPRPGRWEPGPDPDTDDLPEPPFLDELGAALEADHPLPLLLLGSTLIAALETSPQPAELPPVPTLPRFTELLAVEDRIETTAALHVFAAIADDELVRRRAANAAAARSQAVPAWLVDLEPLSVDGAMSIGHVLGDGENLLVGVTTGAGDPLTVIAYVDHNLGTVVKDAFLLDAPIGSVADRFAAIGADQPGTIERQLTPADARALLTEAIAAADTVVPPLHTDTWPGCRPLVGWVLRQLPVGGAGWRRPVWDAADRAALLDELIAAAEDLDAAIVRRLGAALVDFACDRGPGDPLRWSPVPVELVLTRELPHEVVAPTRELLAAPAVLRVLIRLAHAQRDVPAPLTEQTLAAVDQWEPELRRLLAERDASARSITGRPGTGVLDPLPDEPLDLTGLPADIHARVREVAALADGCCDALFDVEHRTACRRLLVDVAAADPAILRRRARTDTAAAAIVWIVARANDSLGRSGVSATAIADWFELSGTPTQRAATMLRALGATDRAPTAGSLLGSTRYTVAGPSPRSPRTHPDS